MAISTYTLENEEVRFRVYVNSRSKMNHEIRAQRKASGIKTQREAEREEVRLIRECEREVADKEAQGSNWGAVVDAWGEYLKKDAANMQWTTRVDYLAAVRKYTEGWKNRAAASITTLDVKELISQMKAQGRSYNFQRKFKNMFNRIFVFGMQSRLIHGLDRSPAYGLQLDRPQEKKPEILTYKEIKKLLIEARRHQHPWYPIWAMALLTGMRNGELYALEWNDINWENRTLTVSRSYNKRFRETKSTKAGYWRTVPISSELLLLLKELQGNANGRPSILPHIRDWRKGLQAKVMRAFCNEIGISSVKFHALRACFATQLIRAGVPAIQLQKICGWRDLKTMQRYIRIAGIEVEGVTENIKFLPVFADEPQNPLANDDLVSVADQTVGEMKSLASDLLPIHLTT